MIQQNLESKPRWTFKKHTKNLNLLMEFATQLKHNKSGISSEDKEKIFDILANSGSYSPRQSIRDKPLDSMNHRLDGLRYYMFGYFDKLDNQDKFIFSPLGNLYIKNLIENNYENRQKIFLTMLFAIQFPHIGSKGSWDEFTLYPFRLIFKLLREPRLNFKLYHSEVEMIVMFIKSMASPQEYTKLVEQIISLRNKGVDYIFSQMSANQHFYVRLVYEWEYYTSKLLESAGIIDRYETSQKKSIKLFHEQKQNSKSATSRKATDGYFQLNPNIANFADILLNEYSIFDTPAIINRTDSLSNDSVKEIYSFYPDILLEEIGEPLNSASIKLLKLPKLIEEYAKNPENSTSNLFEEVLENAFNLFVNVEASRLSGPGRTDIECLYIPISEIFAVEAKSTQNKLSQVNAGRLQRHRNIIGARYTIVVTPRYSPAVKYDIENQDVVIIKANTLSEYFYNEIISNSRNIDYKQFREIVISNLGKDISRNISELTLSKFGHE